MKALKWKTYLEVTTNFAVLLVAIAVLTNLAWVYLGKQPSPHLGPGGGLRKGDAFPVIPGIDYRQSGRTLVIALSSRCDHCSESIPFLKGLFEAVTSRAESTRVVAVFPEKAGEALSYITQQQLNVDPIPGVDYKALNLPGTPSLVLISNEGKVLNFWIGRPSKDTEKEIMEAITE